MITEPQLREVLNLLRDSSAIGLNRFIYTDTNYDSSEIVDLNLRSSINDFIDVLKSNGDISSDRPTDSCPPEPTIELRKDNSLHDLEIDMSVGFITGFDAECEAILWVAPSQPMSPRMYTAQNLRDIADIIDEAKSTK